MRMRRSGLSLLGLIVVLGMAATVLWPRPTRLSGPVYSVPQVEAMLAHPLGQRAGQTVLVRALVLPGCPWPNGGGAWYECRLAPASLSAALHRRNQTVRITDVLTLEAPYPSRVGRRRGILRPFSVGPSAKPDMPAFQASGFPVRGYRS